MCRGSSEGVSTSGANDLARYKKLKQRYQNCTYVDGNLEIKFLEQENETFDLSFLSKIEEVSGYVLITSVTAETIPLTSLKIIRGNQLFNFKNHSYSLFVGVNSHETKGLKELLLTNLSGNWNTSSKVVLIKLFIWNIFDLNAMLHVLNIIESLIKVNFHLHN